MSLEVTRRTMMTGTAAIGAATALPLSFLATAPASAHMPDDRALCLSSHDWLSRRLHDALARTDMDEAWRVNAVKTNSCPHCGVHVGAAETGLIAH